MADKPKQNNEFHIAFWVVDHPKEAGAVPPGWISAVKVTIQMDIIPPEHGDLATKYSVALDNHPLYQHLRTYVLNNKGK